MSSRSKILKIFNRDNNQGMGFWTGEPHKDTLDLYLSELGLDEKEDLFAFLHDDCRWFPADAGYKHPEGKPMFDFYLGEEKKSLNQPGCFAECDSLDQVDNFPWPDPGYLDFSVVMEKIELHQDKAIFSGMWSPFFHIVADFFGMDNYFLKMYTDPLIVEAVTEKVVDFLIEANDRFFREASGKVDVFFFGNDFGTQRDLLVSPEDFRHFILPSFKRLIAVGRKYDKKILLHSCGSIIKVIPDLIDAGIDALHPLQAKAYGMDAVNLARNFKNRIAFNGGVDTQQLLIHSSPEEVKEEVLRLYGILGPNYIAGPSHEAILPNVPLRNIVALSRAARSKVNK